MKVLLVYPENPDTFWSFKHVMRFVSKRSPFPPLGLLTVAAMLPREWELKLVDLNVEGLTDAGLAWADYVMVSAMIVHKASVSQIVARCVSAGVPVIAGGPLFTTAQVDFPGIQHFVLGEAEDVMPELVQDMVRGCVKACVPGAGTTGHQKNAGAPVGPGKPAALRDDGGSVFPGLPFRL